MIFMPRLLILHGKETTIQVMKVLSEKGMLLDPEIEVTSSIDYMEKQVPFHYFPI